MPRVDHLLSDDDLQAEKESREKRFAAEDKFEALRRQRSDSLNLVDRLSEEILTLQKRRQELNTEVQNAHDSFRSLGDQQKHLREERKRLFDRLEELTHSLHKTKGENTRDKGPNARSVAAEIARLEREQQTRVMTLKEENALIDRIRHMRSQLLEREKVEADWMKTESEASTVKDEILELRKKLQQANERLDSFHGERDAAMAKIQSSLGEVGHVLNEIRSKGKIRTDMLDKARGIAQQMQEMGRTVLDLQRESRKRVSEARARIAEHGSHQRSNFNEGARERAADELLSALLKNGKVELGLGEPDEVPAASTADEKDSRRRRG